ncbi:MAG: DNA primase [Phycisphaerae bacterium]
MAGNSSEVFRMVRDSLDIVDVVGEVLTLHKKGREYVGVCPFHEDHRPSMTVVPHKQIFHCFVCGAGGDVFQFVMRYHKMTAGEALRHLAQKRGIELPELQPRNQEAQEGPSLREQIAQANEKVCQFFQKNLATPGAKAGLEYIQKRGLNDQTLAQFRIGFAPDSFTGLVSASAALGLSYDVMDKAALIRRRGDGSPYDVFRNRVMFPITDAMGRVIAFGGRVLVEKRDEEGNVVEPKYLNSPESLLFNKSESLYGFQHARASIAREDTVVIVEGYMDVIACHQAGVTNVVATLGTALTPEHARILKRICKKVVLVFDSDDAGRRATQRAMQVFIREPLDVHVASVPNGKDPCDYCFSHGGDAFKQVVNSAKDMLAFRWQQLQEQFEQDGSLAARQEGVKQFINFLGESAKGSIIDPVRWGLLIGQVSDLVGLPKSEVQRQLRQTANAPERSTGEQSVAPEHISLANLLRQGSTVASQVWILGALLTHPNLYSHVRTDIAIELFDQAALQNLARQMLEQLELAPDIASYQLADFIAAIEPESLRGLALEIQRQVEQGGGVEIKLRDALRDLLQKNAQEHGPVKDSQDLHQRMQAARARQAQGGNRRITGRQ